MQLQARFRRAALAVAVAASALPAQDAPAVVTKFTADFGYVAVSGNTDVTSLSIGEKLTQSRGRLTLEQTFGIVRGELNGVENTNLLRASLRGSYRLGAHFSSFAASAYDRNPYAGIERRFEHSAGLQFRPVASATDTLRFEGGGSATQQTSIDGTHQTFPAARAAGVWRHQFTPASYFQQNVELIPNLKDGEDFRVNSESSLIAPISARVGIKVSYVIRYDNLPEPGFRTTDRLFTTGIQLTR